MAVRIITDEARTLVIVKVTGELSNETLFEIHRVIEQDPDRRPEFNLLIDFSKAVGDRVTGDGVGRLVEKPLLFAKTSRRAVVVPSDLGFGVARMYELMRDESGGGFRIYRDVAEAEAWLGDKPPSD